MINKKISVILTVSDIEKDTKESILSLVNQNFADYEIIILNNSISDVQSDYIQKYAKSFDFIKYYNFPNYKSGELKNEGIKLSKGEYIICLKGGDIFHEDLLYRMYEQIKIQKADICICNSFEFTGNKKNVIKRYFHKSLPYLHACDKLIKRDLTNKNKIFFSNHKTSNDFLYSFNSYFMADKVVKTDDFLIYKKFCEKPFSNSIIDDVFDALLALQEDLKTRNIYEKFKNEFKTIAMREILNLYSSIKDKNKAYTVFKAIKEYEKDFHISDLISVPKEYSSDLEPYKKAIKTKTYLNFKIQNKLLNFKKIIIK